MMKSFLYLIFLFLISCGNNYSLHPAPRVCLAQQKTSFKISEEKKQTQLKFQDIPVKNYKLKHTKIFFEEAGKTEFQGAFQYTPPVENPVEDSLNKTPVLRMLCLKNIDPRKAFEYNLPFISHLSLNAGTSLKEAFQVHHLIFKYGAKPTSSVRWELSQKTSQTISLNELKKEFPDVSFYQENENSFEIYTTRTFNEKEGNKTKTFSVITKSLFTIEN